MQRDQSERGFKTQSKAVFITHQVFRNSGFGNLHPLSISRQNTLYRMCCILDWFTPDQLLEPELASRSVLETYHERQYIDEFFRAAVELKVDANTREKFGLGTMECPLFEGIWDRATASIGGAILAAEQALDGKLVFHPAGGTHHSLKGRASGFCYFNGPVFAIQTLLQKGLDRVCYVDLDAHHGDGVEAAYMKDPRVQLLSVHEQNRWPYTGATSRPHNNCFNLSIPSQVNDTEFEFLIDQGLFPQIESWKPEALVITCGADVLEGDPLSSMALSNVAVWNSIRKLQSLTPHTIILGGGGYNPWGVIRCWSGLWAQLAGYGIPEKLPIAVRNLLKNLDCDLIDQEEIKSDWLETLQDKENDGPIRAEFQNLVKQLDSGPDVI